MKKPNCAADGDDQNTKKLESLKKTAKRSIMATQRNDSLHWLSSATLLRMERRIPSLVTVSKATSKNQSHVRILKAVRKLSGLSLCERSLENCRGVLNGQLSWGSHQLWRFSRKLLSFWSAVCPYCTFVQSLLAILCFVKTFADPLTNYLSWNSFNGGAIRQKFFQLEMAQT